MRDFTKIKVWQCNLNTLVKVQEAVQNLIYYEYTPLIFLVVINEMALTVSRTAVVLCPSVCASTGARAGVPTHIDYRWCTQCPAWYWGRLLGEWDRWVPVRLPSGFRAHCSVAALHCLLHLSSQPALVAVCSAHFGSCSVFFFLSTCSISGVFVEVGCLHLQLL